MIFNRLRCQFHFMGHKVENAESSVSLDLAVIFKQTLSLLLNFIEAKKHLTKKGINSSF